MKLLALDTASRLCAACVFDTETVAELGRAVRDIGKGHAEHLIETVNEAMETAGLAFSELGAVGVSIGPGSFTGIRVGVSAARGFALALKVPAVGVSTLEAIAAETRDVVGAVTVMGALEGGRGAIHAALFDAAGAPLRDPFVATLEDAVALALSSRAVLAGSAAERIAADPRLAGVRVASVAATADIAVYARLAASRAGSAEKPMPLYLREADAKPQAGFVLPRRGA